MSFRKATRSAPKVVGYPLPSEGPCGNVAYLTGTTKTRIHMDT